MCVSGPEEGQEWRKGGEGGREGRRKGCMLTDDGGGFHHEDEAEV